MCQMSVVSIRFPDIFLVGILSRKISGTYGKDHVKEVNISKWKSFSEKKTGLQLSILSLSGCFVKHLTTVLASAVLHIVK